MEWINNVILVKKLYQDKISSMKSKIAIRDSIFVFNLITMTVKKSIKVIKLKEDKDILHVKDLVMNKDSTTSIKLDGCGMTYSYPLGF